VTLPVTAVTPSGGRLTLLVTSPRVAPGLLTRDAWTALAAAAVVYAAGVEEPLVLAVAESGIPVSPLDPGTPRPYAARLLLAAAAGSQVVWLGSADGDPGLTDAIASEVARVPDPPEVEVVVGSWDVPGARLLDVVAVMDRLRSPGGCPWDAEQTHQSLLPYLHEEAGEFAEAVASGDQPHMAEELGDVLLQVAFHARVAQEHPSEPFDIDDVAGHLVDKLVRRHPHVFADGDASTPAEVEAQWARIKEQEKADKHP
jgi:XTP/dITP diphosphohydrolase